MQQSKIRAKHHSTTCTWQFLRGVAQKWAVDVARAWRKAQQAKKKAPGFQNWTLEDDVRDEEKNPGYTFIIPAKVGLDEGSINDGGQAWKCSVPFSTLLAHDMLYLPQSYRQQILTLLNCCRLHSHTLQPVSSSFTPRLFLPRGNTPGYEANYQIYIITLCNNWLNPFNIHRVSDSAISESSDVRVGCEEALLAYCSGSFSQEWARVQGSRTSIMLLTAIGFSFRNVHAGEQFSAQKLTKHTNRDNYCYKSSCCLKITQRQLSCPFI